MIVHIKDSAVLTPLLCVLLSQVQLWQTLVKCALCPAKLWWHSYLHLDFKGYFGEPQGPGRKLQQRSSIKAMPNRALGAVPPLWPLTGGTTCVACEFHCGEAQALQPMRLQYGLCPANLWKQDHLEPTFARQRFRSRISVLVCPEGKISGPVDLEGRILSQRRLFQSLNI